MLHYGIQRIFPNSECYINNTDALSLPAFAKRAGLVVEGIQFVRVRGYDEMWSSFIFHKCKKYRNSDRFKQKRLVTSIGKQEDSNVWVLSPELQIDGGGNIIDPEHHSYYWDYDIQEQICFKPLKISLPLSNEVCMLVCNSIL